MGNKVLLGIVCGLSFTFFITVAGSPILPIVKDRDAGGVTECVGHVSNDSLELDLLSPLVTILVVDDTAQKSPSSQNLLNLPETTTGKLFHEDNVFPFTLWFSPEDHQQSEDDLATTEISHTTSGWTPDSSGTNKPSGFRRPTSSLRSAPEFDDSWAGEGRNDDLVMTTLQPGTSGDERPKSTPTSLPPAILKDSGISSPHINLPPAVDIKNPAVNPPRISLDHVTPGDREVNSNIASSTDHPTASAVHPLAVDLSVHRPEVELPVHRPAVELPDHRPIVELPVHRPAVELPDHRPIVELPDHRPIVELPVHRPVVESLVPRPDAEPLVNRPAVVPAIQRPEVHRPEITSTVQPASVEIRPSAAVPPVVQKELVSSKEKPVFPSENGENVLVTKPSVLIPPKDKVSGAPHEPQQAPSHIQKFPESTPGLRPTQPASPASFPTASVIKILSTSPQPVQTVNLPSPILHGTVSAPAHNVSTPLSATQVKPIGPNPPLVTSQEVPVHQDLPVHIASKPAPLVVHSIQTSVPTLPTRTAEQVKKDILSHQLVSGSTNSPGPRLPLVVTTSERPGLPLTTPVDTAAVAHTSELAQAASEPATPFRPTPEVNTQKKVVGVDLTPPTGGSHRVKHIGEPIKTQISTPSPPSDIVPPTHHSQFVIPEPVKQSVNPSITNDGAEIIPETPNVHLKNEGEKLRPVKVGPKATNSIAKVRPVPPPTDGLKISKHPEKISSVAAPSVPKISVVKPSLEVPAVTPALKQPTIVVPVGSDMNTAQKSQSPSIGGIPEQVSVNPNSLPASNHPVPVLPGFPDKPKDTENIPVHLPGKLPELVPGSPIGIIPKGPEPSEIANVESKESEGILLPPSYSPNLPENAAPEQPTILPASIPKHENPSDSQFYEDLFIKPYWTPQQYIQEAFPSLEALANPGGFVRRPGKN